MATSETNFIPAGGEIEPKLVGTHTYAELKYATLKESELVAPLATTKAAMLIGRVA